MRSARRSGVDTISNLPCNVLDEILGCLPWKDAAKTSILSKDWRYKWVTRAKLDFNSEFFRTFRNNQEAKIIIYQILLLHKGQILKFTLQGPNVTSCPDINHWIIFLSTKIVEEFTLHISSGNKYHLPSQFFTFRQLRHLKIQSCLFYPPPDFKGFENLINLDFRRVIFDPAIVRNLISKCLLLEKLRLHWCKDFHILEIDAPNLKFFEFVGKLNSICFKNAPMLRSATVWLISEDLEQHPSTIYSNLSKFFHYMPSLQELSLCGSTLEYLMMGGLPESPPTSLNNIKSLHILHMSLRNVKEVEVAVYLITSCPKLQELKIECFDVEPDVQCVRAQSIYCGVVKLLLRRVEMYDLTGSEMEMGFIKFILASSPVLEEILICNKGMYIHRGRVREIMHEMKQFPRVSPNVRFIYEEALPVP